MTDVDKDAAHVAAVAAKLGKPQTVWIVLTEYDRESAVQLVCSTHELAIEFVKACITEDVKDGNVDEEDAAAMFDSIADGQCGVEHGTWYNIAEHEVKHA